MWAAGLDKWLAPVGFPLRMEHFWKCRFKMSLLENVSLHKTHMYGLSPVSMNSQPKERVRSSDGLTAEKVSLQMFGVQICLVAVRTGEFPIRIFCRDRIVLRSPISSVGDGRCSAGSTGQNASSSLRPHHMSSLVFWITSSVWSCLTTGPDWPAICRTVRAACHRIQIALSVAWRRGSYALRVRLGDARWWGVIVGWLVLLTRLGQQ